MSDVATVSAVLIALFAAAALGNNLHVVPQGDRGLAALLWSFRFS